MKNYNQIMERLEVENKELREVLKEARSFVDCHSEEWYTTGQQLLSKIDEVMQSPDVSEGDYSNDGT